MKDDDYLKHMEGKEKRKKHRTKKRDFHEHDDELYDDGFKPKKMSKKNRKDKYYNS